MDYEKDRIHPTGCNPVRNSYFFNMYIDGGKPIAGNSKNGYIFWKGKVEAGKTHSL